MAVSSRKKSTIVRAKTALALGSTRTAFRVLEAVAPGVGARWAERIWLTVPRKAWRPATPIEVPPGEPFTLTVGRSTVHGRVWGDGPAVYLMHGWGGVAEQLDAFVEPLLAGGHRVVSFDAPGHGKSSQSMAGPGRSTLPEFIDALQSSIERYGPAHAVIAHSFGAAAAVLAILDGVPTGSLVVIAPMGDPIGFSYGFAKMLGFGEKIRTGFLKILEKRVGQPMSVYDIPKRLAAVPPELPPLLIIHDLKDREVPFGSGEQLNKLWLSARLQSTSGLGHYRILIDPEVVKETVAFSSEPRTLPVP